MPVVADLLPTETKNSWARDDPAVFILISMSMSKPDHRLPFRRSLNSPQLVCPEGLASISINAYMQWPVALGL